MDIYYVYGKEFGRFDESVVKLRIEVPLVQQLVKLGATRDDNAIDEYYERLEDLIAERKLTHQQMSMMMAIVGEDSNDPDIKKAAKGKPFFILIEEAAYAFAPTKDGARALFLENETQDIATDDWGD